MNAYTLHLIGRAAGRIAFQNGLKPIPDEDRDFQKILLKVSPSANKIILEGWHEGWNSFTRNEPKHE